MRMRTRKPKGPKRVNYKLIDPKSDVGKGLFKVLRDLIVDYHEDLRDARIALAWSTGWKRDVDGREKLGQCKKASDLDREFAPYDFVIVLNRIFFEDANVSDKQRRAVLDHELCHAGVKYDKTGDEPEVDERGRKVWRLKKHTIEDFSEIVERHGVYKRDVELFAQALRRSKQIDLPIDKEPKAKAS